MRQWQQWHDAYADPHSSLSRRLRVVQRFLAEVLPTVDTDSRVLSLCAGDGRDIIPLLGQMPEAARPAVTLVELDAVLADAARQRAAAATVDVTVLTVDAGWMPNWAAHAPADLLLLCGIFGNIPDEDVRTTINATPALLRPGGVVVWTRSGQGGPKDLRRRIRAWFNEAGLNEVAFECETSGYGVGFNCKAAEVDAPPVSSERLFKFRSAGCG